MLTRTQARRPSWLRPLLAALTVPALFLAAAWFGWSGQLWVPVFIALTAALTILPLMLEVTPFLVIGAVFIAAAHPLPCALLAVGVLLLPDVAAAVFIPSPHRRKPIWRRWRRTTR